MAIRKRMKKDFNSNTRKAIKKSISKSFKSGKAKGATSKKGTMGAKVKAGAAQRGAAALGRGVKSIKKNVRTGKKEFRAQAMSDSKAGRTFGSRKSAAGAIAGAARRKSFGGKVGAKAGGVYKMTAARKAALMKAVKASAAKRRGRKQ